MEDIVVENIVASTKLADQLDLDAIVLALDGAEYEPEQFPGLIYRLKKPKTAMLIFRSGKANCTGAKNLEDVRTCISTVRDMLDKSGMDVYEEPEITVQNMVAVYDLKSDLNLNAIAISLGLENVEYEPEQFPGMVYRVYDPKVVLLLFSSGKVVCTGAKKVEDIDIAVKRLRTELSNAGLLH
ncbi:MAG: TATA-box-binding protein [Thermoplasmata archaeon]|nr:TATA-box-binding protein [Thermoplasmata archaeon]